MKTTLNLHKIIICIDSAVVHLPKLIIKHLEAIK